MQDTNYKKNGISQGPTCGQGSQSKQAAQPSRGVAQLKNLRHAGLVGAAVIGVSLAAGLFGCTSVSSAPAQVSRQAFGHTPEGTPIELFTLRNAGGAEARICNYGGLVISLKVPDRNGKLGDVVLGYDNLADYIKDTPYFGALIGRYGNRIANGRFTLDGVEHQVDVNNGINHLHGGTHGFHRKLWTGETFTTPASAG